MTSSKSILTFDNAVKAGFLLGSLCGFYFKIVSDIRDMSTEKRFQVEHLQYQITELKDCCNGQRGGKRLVFNQQPAVAPNEVEFKTEE